MAERVQFGEMVSILCPALIACGGEATRYSTEVTHAAAATAAMVERAVVAAVVQGAATHPPPVTGNSTGALLRSASVRGSDR